MTAFLALVPVLAFCAPSSPAAPVSDALASAAWARVDPIVSSLDKGDEESAFIAGLAKRGLHDIVVREARSFLERRSSHRRAPAVRYRLADALFELGKVNDSVKEYERLDRIAGFEQAIEVKFRLGQLKLDLGANGEAATLLNAVRTSDAKYLRVPSTYLLGEALFRDGKFEPASAAYTAVLQSGADAADYARDARYGLTWSHWKAGARAKTIEAADGFLNSHAGDPQAGEIAFLAGEAHLEEKRPADAIQRYESVKTGNYVEAAMRGAAFAESERGDHAASAQRFGRYLQKFPKGQFAAEAALQRGVQLVRAEQFGDAVNALTKAPTVQDAQARYWAATAYAGLGQHERAYDAAAAGLRQKPDEAMAVQLRIAAGDALFELGRTKEAAAIYEQSGSAYAMHAAAVARLNAGDAEEAERLARTLLSGAAREPGAEYRADALMTRAESLFRLERYSEAEPVLRMLLAETQPKASGNGGAATPPVTVAEPALVARAGSRLAWCRWYADDTAAASAMFRSVASNRAAADAERAEAQFMAGRAALKGGDDAQASAAFRSYLSSNPKGSFTAEALLRLARLTPGAQGTTLYEKLVSEHDSSPLLAAGLAELAERRTAAGDNAGAGEAYGKLAERFPNDPLSRNARYGLGWARYQAGDLKGASEPLWAVARDGKAENDLRNAALELLVWVEAGNEDTEKTNQAFRAFAARSADEARVLAAARVVDGVLDAKKDVEGRAELWRSVKTKLKGPEAASAALIESGFVALDRGKPEEAAREALAARQIAPKSADVSELLFFVGEAYFASEDDERAAPLYVAASAHGTPEVAERALYKAGFAELRRGKNAEAAKAFGSLVERFPRGMLAPESMFLAGEAEYRNGNHEAAAPWLRRMVKEAPQHASRAKALFRLGLAEGQLEEWRPCADALTELVAKHTSFPSVTEAELWRGRAQSRLGERRASRQSLSRVIESDEGILAAQARIELGRLFEAENDDEAAIAEYLKVAVLYGHEEECAEALVRAGDVLLRQGSKDRARERFQEVVEDYPDAAWAKEAKTRLSKDGAGKAGTSATSR